MYLVCAVADHRVGLARARLPVGEQTAMIALPGIGQNLQADLLEHDLLIRVLVPISPGIN